MTGPELGYFKAGAPGEYSREGKDPGESEAHEPARREQRGPEGHRPGAGRGLRAPPHLETGPAEPSRAEGRLSEPPRRQGVYFLGEGSEVV